jgi:hypothetical protein
MNAVFDYEADDDSVNFRRDKANRDFKDKREKFRGDEYGHHDEKRSKGKNRRKNDKRKFLDEDDKDV